MTVDEYVASKVSPEHRETVARLRALVRECAPQVEESISYGMPVFNANGKTFAWILPNPKHVTLGFREGRALEDKFDLLRGTGKHAKNLKLKSADSVEPDVLRYYIGQAVERDSRP
ncbi:MAG: DUF1801 domain-containing protein [Chloroflexi bacterium]|nr:MAG: DUF1801 domain-containing protein [Chloroflexota bacterium]TMD50993.1 MAG: DUF1801 domain-containing protein [Chloroflexota bacterium]